MPEPIPDYVTGTAYALLAQIQGKEKKWENKWVTSKTKRENKTK